MTNLCFSPWFPSQNDKNWTDFLSKWKSSYVLYSQFNTPEKDSQKIFTFQWPNSFYKKNNLFDTHPGKEKLFQFSGLVLEYLNEFSYLQVYKYSLFLATLWHAKLGGLCLHSSTVTRKQKGFMFLGASTSGKTTVAKLSNIDDNIILGDDINFLIKINGTYRISSAPSISPLPVGYSEHQPLLCGIFILKKDTSDYLIPLSSYQVANFLFDSFIESPPGTKIPSIFMEQIFHNIGDIARQIPGYELHFRKSPDFWQLIDEQFPD